MISFILNQETIHTAVSPGMTVLDFVRYHQHLKGTKIGCREGDCGACTLLVGELHSGKLRYQTMTSCLMPLRNAARKHIVTIEGINPPSGKLTPVQSAMAEESGTQCGFCTVGFVQSLTCFCLDHPNPQPEDAISAIDGNICRCTGYKSIERATEKLCTLLQSRGDINPVEFAITTGIVPEWFSSIPARLSELQTSAPLAVPSSPVSKIIGGGTDLYVQRPEEMVHEAAIPVADIPALREIKKEKDRIVIGGSVTVTALWESELLRSCFPKLTPHIKLVSSTPIRNMATVAGNLVNASPIGDLTVWFLAMDAIIVLRNGSTREVPLRDFYQGYKALNKHQAEWVEKILFKIPDAHTWYNFEKVSKRRYLDIASVNTAISIRMIDNTIQEAHVAAGGVAPIPLYLRNISSCLMHKTLPLSEACWRELNHSLQAEIQPIDDVRGSAVYKRLLLQQLFRAHFTEFAASHEKH